MQKKKSEAKYFYLYIFETTALLSRYLQINSLNRFTAWCFVDSAIKLKEQARTSDKFHCNVLEFIYKFNDKVFMNMDEN